MCLVLPNKGAVETREGEAPAEPLGGKLLIQNGSAGASPSRGTALFLLMTT